MENSRPFIFYLTLSERLPDQYYVFDALLREAGYVLVPVKFDQLQQLVARTEQAHVLVLSCVTSFREYKIFSDKVRGILKYVLKSKRLSFFEFSSFSKLNDSRLLGLGKNYFFIKTPVDARAFVERLVSYHERKSEKSDLWPGGARSIAGTQ